MKLGQNQQLILSAINSGVEAKVEALMEATNLTKAQVKSAYAGLWARDLLPQVTSQVVESEVEPVVVVESEVVADPDQELHSAMMLNEFQFEDALYEIETEGSTWWSIEALQAAGELTDQGKKWSALEEKWWSVMGDDAIFPWEVNQDVALQIVTCWKKEEGGEVDIKEDGEITFSSSSAPVTAPTVAPTAIILDLHALAS